MTTEPTGYEDFCVDDTVLPRYVLVQPTSKEGKAGTLRNRQTDEGHTSINITPLQLKKGRVYWGDSTDSPVCRSRDGAMPDPGIAEPCASSCDSCPKSKWDNDTKAPPQCKETRLLTAIHHADTDVPFLLSLHGTNIKPSKQMITWYMSRELPLYAARCTVDVKKSKNAKGNFFVLDFSNFERHDDETVERIKGIAAQLRGYDADRTFQSEQDIPF